MDRYLIVSTDGHAGLPMEGYRDFVEARFHEAFDKALPVQREMTRKAEEKFLISDFNDNWRRGIEDDLAGAWDGAVRNRVIDADGVAAEVLFPDGITEMNAPPFGAGLGLRPWGVDPQLQWAGARAHNRWIAEFCREDPDRRIGLAIVLMLYDVDQALKEVQWAYDNGLKGILIPALMGDHDPYNHPKYDPIWAFCQDHGMVVHTHSGPSPDYNFDLPGAVGVYLTEFAWWASRPLWHMIFGGVFERFPRLHFVITEVSEFWIPHLLELMDVRASVKHTSGKLGDFRSNLTLKPSEYFRRNCWVGASALFDESSTAVRHDIGINNVMWGTDYPHPEGSWPHTRQKLREFFTGMPPAEIEAILGGNAVDCYHLDRARLDPIAARVGPLRSDYATTAGAA
ncbi:amidohydrolase family protein [Parahaliea mediterranea]|uniref:Amidohydrolase family protein n=1 Tax=Parahaliea mediterranea TaxID=651086 RepID=A0A939DGG6_9GAMM|nr:amidohydrolase family protein [Parahaliea mediterranea]MBN7797077.1 amidohydrolase family protein [Parahaliea mediterranea]